MFNRAGECRRFRPEHCTDETPAIIFIHGLFSYGFHFLPFARRMAKHGYLAVLYDYPTRRKFIAGHGDDFRQYLRGFLAANPARRIHIITHSLGSLITRSALAGLTDAERARFGRIVMLAPPNRGSVAATRVCRYLPFAARLWKPILELDCEPDSPVHAVPLIPGVEVGILSARYDHLVREEFTHLENEADHLILPQLHLSMPFSRKAENNAEAFLTGGHFRRSEH